MTNGQFEEFLPRYARDIRRLALKLGKRDADLVDDLFQEGLISLWKLDVSTVRENEGALVRLRCYNAMVDFIRRVNPERSLPLSQFLVDDQEHEQAA